MRGIQACAWHVETDHCPCSGSPGLQTTEELAGSAYIVLSCLAGTEGSWRPSQTTVATSQGDTEFSLEWAA